jgi:peptide/nickel transport system permease protein
MGRFNTRHELLHDKKFLLGFAIICYWMSAALIVPFLPLPNPEASNPLYAYLPPSFAHPLGTNNWGQDLFSQIMWGVRLSLVVGIISAVSATFIGTCTGLVAGYYGKWLDEVLMRLTDTILIVPALPLMITLGAYLGPSVWTIVFVITLTTWPLIARAIRSQVLTLRTRPYVDVARTTGMSNVRILFAVILPNVFPLVVATGVLTVSGAIVAEAGLDFIGLGDPNLISWGTMLFWAQRLAFFHGAWWWFLGPGVAVAMLGSAFVLMGFAIEVRANPNLRSV